MKLTLIILLFSVTQVWGRRLESVPALAKCHDISCQSENRFNCKCEDDEWWNTQKKNIFATGPIKCIPNTWLCDGWKDCDDGSDEIDCNCKEGEFQCSFCEEIGFCVGTTKRNLYQCIPNNLVNNTHVNCLSEKDEKENVESLCYQEQRCDGSIDCPWITPNDEENCNGCPSYKPNRCKCNKVGAMTCKGNGGVCYRKEEDGSLAGGSGLSLFDIDPSLPDYGFGDIFGSEECDQEYHCTDRSDEQHCQCQDTEFQCQCYKNNPVDCKERILSEFTGCVNMSKYNDGKEDCPDGSDEIGFHRIVECGGCNVTIRRFPDVSECSQANVSLCNISTCYKVPSLLCSTRNCSTTDVICTTIQDCRPVRPDCSTAFQCENGNLALASQFCNGRFDCPDHSDEKRNEVGFKCFQSIGTCVLPQRNLYDNVSQCSDSSDLCLTEKEPCFKCLDGGMLISPSQVCDGTNDCHDFSDECLCEINIHNSFCNRLLPFKDSELLKCPFVHNDTSMFQNRLSSFINTTTKECLNKYDNINATLCDGNPECRDLSDECGCKNPPAFCNDTCHTKYPLGDRYCDGIIDEAYKYIKNSDCPKGFDEINCPNRFYCKSGHEVSIHVDEVCNGKQDCDDNSDESNCTTKRKWFSSETEMIESPALKFCFWAIGFAVITGNLYVLITTTRFIRSTKLRKSILYQYIIVLNISFADLIMGFYLLTIASHSAQFSGIYGDVDLEWRSGLSCSFIGSLAVLSSEASCFLMVILTGFRLFKIYFPISALTVSTRRWKISIASAWLLAFTLAMTPVFYQSSFSSSSYFIHGIWFSNKFTLQPIWDEFNITRFACRLAQLTNHKFNFDENLQTADTFLDRYFPKYAPKGKFGYYGETSVCMPRFFVEHNEHAWEYTLVIITINFLCFFVIAVSYALIYMRSVRSPVELKKNLSAKQEATMQRRIAMIIFSDSCCWIPICIMTYIKLSGHHLSNDAYIISAALLLPINSAFNPLLYTSLLDQLIDICKTYGRKLKKAEAATNNIQMRNVS